MKKDLLTNLVEYLRKGGKDEEKYCTDCNGEVAVRLEDCPRYKEEMRKRRKNE